MSHIPRNENCEESWDGLENWSLGGQICQYFTLFWKPSNPNNRHSTVQLVVHLCNLLESRRLESVHLRTSNCIRSYVKWISYWFYISLTFNTFIHILITQAMEFHEKNILGSSVGRNRVMTRKIKFYVMRKAQHSHMRMFGCSRWGEQKGLLWARVEL